MSKSEELALKVAGKYSKTSGNREAAFDPSTLLVFAEMILTFAELFKNCNKTPAQAVSSARNPSLWERVLLRSHVRRSLDRKEFRERGSEIMEALLSGGKEVSEEDFKELYNEV
jgi:hypothetical protein